MTFDPDLDVPALIMTWGLGWTTSRGAGAPVPVPGGWYAEVNVPGHSERHILHTWDAARLKGVAPRPGGWIKVVGSRDDLRAALPEPWLMDEDGHLMTTALRPAEPRIPGGYRVEITGDGPVVKATARHTSGDVAATAYLAPGGGYGIIDRVETSPAHRRRGLGTAVMTALQNHAAGAGLSHGLLLATDAGRALYETLGWTARASIVAARIPD